VLFPHTLLTHTCRALAGGKPIRRATVATELHAGDQAACGALAALLASTCERVGMELHVYVQEEGADISLSAALPGTLTPLLEILDLYDTTYNFLQDGPVDELAGYQFLLDPSLSFPALAHLSMSYPPLAAVHALCTLQVGAGARVRRFRWAFKITVESHCLRG
jgi:hypothetical protein